MASEDERTGFEWLDRPFMLTRILITLLGTLVLALIAYRIAYVVMFERLVPRPPTRSLDGPEEDEPVRLHGWGERRPLQELGGLAVVSILPASIVILIWRRPRAGFLLAAFGGLPLWLPFGFLPALWLCFAAWKVGRSTSSPGGGASLP
jgi:hypothetical protein